MVRLYFGSVFCECPRPTACNRRNCFFSLSTGAGQRHEYLQLLCMFTLVHNTDVFYVGLDVLYRDTWHTVCFLAFPLDGFNRSDDAFLLRSVQFACDNATSTYRDSAAIPTG